MEISVKKVLVLFVILAPSTLVSQVTSVEQMRSRLENVKRMSTIGTTACSDFTILDGAQLSTYSRLAVIQHRGTDNMILLLDGSGRPLAFVKNDFFAYVSPEHPGKLVFSERSKSKFEVSGNKTLEFQYTMGITDSVGTEFIWDPGSFALTALGHAEELSDNIILKSLFMRTKRSRLVIDIAKAENAQSEISVIGLQNRPTGISQAAIFLNGIPTGCDLGKVDVDSIRRMGIPFGPEVVVNRDLFDDEILKDDKQIETAHSLGTVTPCSSSIAAWISATRKRRLGIAEKVAISVVGIDAKRCSDVHDVVKRRSDHLDVVSGKLARGILSLDAAQKELDSENDPVIPFCSILSDEEYVSFAIQYLSSPQLFGTSDEAREVECAAMAETLKLKVNKSVQFLMAESCLAQCRTMEITEDDYFAERIGPAAVIDQYGNVQKNFDSQVFSVLTPDQSAAVSARCTEISRKYEDWRLSKDKR